MSVREEVPAPEEELELDVLDVLAAVADDLLRLGLKEADDIKAEVLRRHATGVRQGIVEIQWLRRDLEKIHTFTNASRVGTRRRALVRREV